MRKRSSRRLIVGIGVLVLAFLAFISIFSLMPYTIAEPATNWQLFIEWNVDAVQVFKDNVVLYGAIALILFVGGYLALKKR
jgi:hypothetical protein